MTTGPDSSPDQQRRAISVLAATLISAATALFLYVAYSARQLRPAADDYCLAVDANLGVLGGALYWFEHLSGYLASLTLGMSLVGWPLLTLPWGIGSMIPFLLAALLVGALVALVLQLSFNRWSWVSLSLIPVGAVAWWTFLWLPQGYGADGFPRWMAYTLTHWQTNNGIYVAQTVIITAACLSLWRIKERRPFLNWLFLVVGFVSGFCGPTVVLTLVALSVIGLVFGSLIGTLHGAASRRSLALLASGSMLGGVFAQLAPGSLARQEILGTSLELSARRIGELVQATTPEAVFIWIQSFAHGGAASLVLLAVCVGWIYGKLDKGFMPAKAVSFALLLTSASLVASLAARFTQLFAYTAWWHFTPVWILSFAALSLFGVAGGISLSRSTYKWNFALVASALALWIFLAIGALLIATTGMAERLMAWNAGPAPLGGIVSDIQDPDGFERKCWNNLMQLRAVPERGIRSLSPGAPWGSEGGSFQREAS